MVYSHDFPISFLKQYHLSDEIHYQSDTLDIIYITAGRLSVHEAIGDKTTYSAGDIFVLYPEHVYILSPDKENIFIHIGLGQSYLQQYHISSDHIICNSHLEPNRNYTHVKNIVANIASEYLDDSRDSELALYSLYFQLLNLIRSEYSVMENTRTLTGDRYQERINEIKKYLQNNYRHAITLSSLAEYMYLTPPYLSKFFKKHFNMNFNQYLNHYRIERSLRDIMYTDKKITDIAVYHGFPNISTFNRHFKDIYGISPREYRQTASPEPPKTAQWLADNQEYGVPEKIDDINKRHITVSAVPVAQFPHNFTTLINVGYAKSLLSDTFRQGIANSAHMLDLKYIRLEGLISNALIPRLAASNSYHFAGIDIILNFLYDKGLIPFIELGKNTFDLFNTNSPKTPAHPFQHQDKFFHMLEAFLERLGNLYDPHWLNQWHFELWKHPGMDVGTYVEDYIRCLGLIKKYLPDAKFGGPGHNTAYLSDELDAVLFALKGKGISPDFVSVHTFLIQNDIKNPNKVDFTVSSRSLAQQQRWIKERVAEIFEKPLPIYITEFNSVMLSRTFINESCYQAAFVAKSLLEINEYVDMTGYWLLDENTFISLANEYIRNQEISLINRNGFLMPAFHAYGMLNCLGSHLIEKGENYCITQSEEGHYEILTYNYAHFSNIEPLIKNKEYSIADTYSYFEKVPTIEMQFTLENLEPGQYKIKRTLLDRFHGSLIDVYIGGSHSSNIAEAEYLYKMKTPTPADALYLRYSCIPEQRNIFIETDGVLTVSIGLSAHNVCLFQITREI